MSKAPRDSQPSTVRCLLMGWLKFVQRMNAVGFLFVSSLVAVLGSVTVASAAQPISLMFVSNHAFSRTSLDSTLRSKLAQSGVDLQVDTCNYSDLTAERLSRCNLVILTYPSGVRQKMLSAAPLVLDYVKSGGGLVVMSDECADSNPLLNEFVSKFDAKVLLESPVDQATLFQQPGFLRHWFCSTENVKQHPVTNGIKTLFYPLADDPDSGGGTQVLDLGSEWTPLILANPSAYYYSIADKKKVEPGQVDPKPLLGARSYGKGRVVLLASRSLNYLHQPYHKLFEGICLERGDGLTLIHNILTWVSHSAREVGNPGGYIEPKLPVTASPLSPELVRGLDYYEKAYRLGIQCLSGKRAIGEISLPGVGAGLREPTGRQ